MHKRTLLFGLGGGLLFFAHAMINNSHAWPLVWPFLAGALAVWTNHNDAHASYRGDIGKAASVGLVAGAIFVVATAVTLSQLGLDGGVGLAGLAMAALIGLVGAMLGGALVHPLAKRT
jgi:O-antigen/teichoic acid export membrane protein